MAQCLGRQAVTALGRGPARLAPTRPSPHPVWPGLTGVSQPTPSGQAGALHYRVPSPGLGWCRGPLQNKACEAAIVERYSPETEGTWQRSPCRLCAPPAPGFSGMGPSGVCC